jgi:hypothetical protein
LLFGWSETIGFVSMIVGMIVAVLKEKSSFLLKQQQS